MKQSKITGILFLLCIIIMIIFSLIKKEENRNIKESGLLGIFTIEDIYHAKNSYKITYSYDDGNSIVTDTYFCNQRLDVGQRIFGWYYPKKGSITDCKCFVPDTIALNDISHWGFIPTDYCID